MFFWPWIGMDRHGSDGIPAICRVFLLGKMMGFRCGIQLGPRTHVEGLQEQAEGTVVLHPSTVLFWVSIGAILETQQAAVQQESKTAGPNSS